MNRQEFWGLTGQTRWGTEREVSANKLRGLIMKSITEEQATSLSEHFFDVHTDLLKKLLRETDSKLEDIYSSAGDLIGFGYEKFQSLYNSTLDEIEEASDCRTDFTDAIPFKLDLFNRKHCSENWFWLQVAMMDWSNAETTSDKIKEHLILTIPPERLFLLREHFERLWSPLRELALTVDLGGCFTDDDLDDLTSHVIGLGQEAYREVMENPKSLINYSFDHKLYLFSAIPYVNIREDNTCYIDW
ncbi:DUF4240 domain-containing protein [Vibrio crassostreae]|uniref:DUF4240 domain-containing protein n=1 Tax=Vibrio crassostreae TaxID=246167 RepID=UPI001B307F26|nr:DUF4240 domain-containing protein [Vibrio crassostreae]